MKSFNFTVGEEIKDELPKVHDFDTDKILKGYFIGTQENVGKNNSTVYKFNTENGIEAVWETAQLERLFATLEVDSPYIIEYTGEELVKGKDYSFKKFLVSNAKVS